MNPEQTAGQAPAKSVYERVTEQVLRELENGTAPWRKPWRIEFGLPRNLHSGKAYRGINVLTLMSGALAASYPTNYWLTFLQAQELGGFVRRGEHGLPVVFYKRVTEGIAACSADEDEQAPDVHWRSVLKTSTAFDVSQCSGISVPQPPTLTWQPVEAAERIVEGLGIPTHYAGTAAYYQPEADAITMPPRAFFPTVMGFYETYLHEAVHATGHESRLARTLGKSGTEAYAWEELTAEMGSAMLSVVVGVPAPDFANTASYVDHWRQRMQRDARAICEAAASAQRAVEWLLDKAGLALPS